MAANVFESAHDRRAIGRAGEVFHVLTGRRYRLEFDAGQKLTAERIAAACRAVWNIALEQRRAYRRRGAFIGYAEQCRQLADAKKDFPWLAEAPAQALQQTLKDLDAACRRHGTGKVRHARPEAAVGVDRGVVTAAVTSDGEFFDRRHATACGVSSSEPPKTDRVDQAAEQGYLSPGETERYVRLQRRLARAKKGSGRRRRVVRALGAIMGRVRRRRADFNAQAAHRLTRDYAHI
ncbi:RNA-guided endonuclease InsQ/TnpB family protein, partial [Planomonospora algeriensis]